MLWACIVPLACCRDIAAAEPGCFRSGVERAEDFIRTDSLSTTFGSLSSPAFQSAAAGRAVQLQAVLKLHVHTTLLKLCRASKTVPLIAERLIGIGRQRILNLFSMGTACSMQTTGKTPDLWTGLQIQSCGWDVQTQIYMPAWS